MGEKVLVVDSDTESLERIKSLLYKGGYRPVAAEDGCIGLQALKEEGEFAAIIVDEEVGSGLSGLDILQRIKDISPNIPVVMSSTSWTTETLLDCTEEGAFFCVEKQAEAGNDTLLRVLNQAIEEHKLSPLIRGAAPKI
ncbi:MAG: response regulator [Candidatus Brocadiales bacterium]